ncbi:MAG: HD domain-containing protein [Armatimonadetes bacterium]|nr:HD domain-containing protein [Armatimonadota bacterium]
MDSNPIFAEAYEQAIRALLHSLELHNPGESGHATRVAVYSVATGHELGLRGQDLQNLKRAAYLHDIGKVGVPASILTKTEVLTELERQQLFHHSAMAENTLSGFAWIAPCLPAIRHHHERWDGKGYPDGLSGADIPLFARIISVAEAFDAMTNELGWREPLDEAMGINELESNAGTQFDPDVVKAFLKVQPLIQPIEFS